MQRIGQVLHVSPNRKVILKTKQVPRIGNDVVDENLKPIGTIFDVFGPVSSPYIAVKPSVQDPKKLVDCILYAISSNSKRKGRWKKR